MWDRGKPLQIATAAVLGGLLASGLLDSTPTRAQGTGRRVALVIGIGDYGTLGNLSNPPNDAKLIADALRQDGFDVDLVLDADQRKLYEAVHRLGDRIATAGPGATGLFYYAGHGIQAKGVNYLIPSHANIAREADLDLEAVKVDSVLAQMEDASASTNIIVLDACPNAPFARGFRGAEQGLAQMEAPNGTFIAYSTAPGAVAADGAGANSPFASALAQELGQPGEAIEVVFRDVRRNVFQSTSGRQVPWDSSSLTDPFYFRGGAEAANRERPTVTPNLPIPSDPLQTAASRGGSGTEALPKQPDVAVANQPPENDGSIQSGDSAPARGEVFSDDATYQRALADWQAKIEESRQANEAYEKKKAEVARQESEAVEKAKQDRADWERRVAACKGGDYSQCATQGTPQ